MRNFDHSPLYRATVGFERLIDLIDAASRPNWPPYNIEKIDENSYRISMAVAGFGPNDIDVSQDGGELLVSGKKAEADKDRKMLHQGIAFRDFKQSFKLAPHVKVAEAKLENGMLSIGLVREVPEELKPRKIDISTPRDAGDTVETGSEVA